VGVCDGSSAELNVNVMELELATVTGPTMIPTQETLHYTASPLLNDADSILWSLPGGWTWAPEDLDHDDTNAFVIPSPQASSGSVCAQAVGGGCSGAPVCVGVDVIVGMNEANSNREHLTIHPNPNNGSFYIETGASIGLGVLTLWDSVGRRIQELGNLNGLRKQFVVLDGLTSGTYLLRSTCEDKVMTIPVVVQR